eukprot:90922-Chlamydomonas_euryale.AAC.1
MQAKERRRRHRLRRQLRANVRAIFKHHGQRRRRRVGSPRAAGLDLPPGQLSQAPFKRRRVGHKGQRAAAATAPAVATAAVVAVVVAPGTACSEGRALCGMPRRVHRAFAGRRRRVPAAAASAAAADAKTAATAAAAVAFGPQAHRVWGSWLRGRGRQRGHAAAPWHTRLFAQPVQRGARL